MNLRCAAYARYSTDKQRPVSIEDQLRKCREYAERKGWILLPEHVYTDEAISAASLDRPSLRRMLAAAEAGAFNCLLVEDTSRLSRNQADTLALYEKLSFWGVRFVAVEERLDSADPESEIVFGFKSVMNAAQRREVARRTHRGLEGLLEHGLHTGGRVYGYNIVRTEEGSRLVVNDSEAEIVLRIFQLSAGGLSLKGITKILNAEGIPSPRPRKGREAAGWCPSAIREMLYNSRYAGRVIWNRAHFVKVPGKNRRVARPRPPEEWRTVAAEHLRIVPEELWARVHKRLLDLKRLYGQDRARGLSRSATSPYLFSGLLVCAECGARLVAIGKKGHARYGCSRNFYRGTCKNNLRERRDRLEARLLEGLQKAVLQPAAVDYALAAFQKELDDRLLDMQQREASGEMRRLRQEKAEAEAELRRLADAVGKGTRSFDAALLELIAEKERKLRAITQQTLEGQTSTAVDIEELRRFIHSRLTDVRKLLYSDVSAARTELVRHVSEIALRPTEKAGKRYYVATGEWTLLSNEKGPPDEAAPRSFESIAGAGFEPATFGL